jgi:hypothetical protein
LERIVLVIRTVYQSWWGGDEPDSTEEKNARLNNQKAQNDN